MKHRKKIKLVLFYILLGLVLGGAAFMIYDYFYPIDWLSLNDGSKTTVANRLDGTQSDSNLANRHPLAVIVENHPDARPQVGLYDASLVYEAISEGGITRFMAVYGPKEVDKIGPVRSMRTYFLDWAAEFNAFLAHVGGNIDALDRIPQEKALDLDQFALGTKAYWREPVRGVAIEHTMFTSTTKLYQAASEKNFEMSANFYGFKFWSAKKFKSNPGVTQSVNIDFSSPSYAVSYTYNPANRKYLRRLAGLAHKDRLSGDQIAPTNIIIQEVSRHNGKTRINEETWTMNTIGGGSAIVLYAGQKIEATWKKKDLHSRTVFYDQDDNEIRFLPGQFWYEIVPPEVFSMISIITTTTSPSPKASK